MKWNELKRIAIAHGFQFYKGLKGHDLYINRETKKTIMLERHWSQEAEKDWLTNLERISGSNPIPFKQNIIKH